MLYISRNLKLYHEKKAINWYTSTAKASILGIQVDLHRDIKLRAKIITPMWASPPGFRFVSPILYLIMYRCLGVCRRALKIPNPTAHGTWAKHTRLTIFITLVKLSRFCMLTLQHARHLGSSSLQISNPQTWHSLILKLTLLHINLKLKSPPPPAPSFATSISHRNDKLT